MLKSSFVLLPSKFERIFLRALLLVCTCFIVLYLDRMGHFSILLSVIILVSLIIIRAETNNLSSKIEFKGENIIFTINDTTTQATIIESLIINPIGVAFYGIDKENEENNKEKMFYKFIFRDSVSAEDWWNLCLISNYYRGSNV